MATTLIDQWIASNGPLPPLTFAAGDVADNTQAMTSQHFRNRVWMSMLAAAIAIANEAPTTLDHVNRVALAKAALGSPQTWAFPFASALAAIGLDDTSTDASINTGVASIWNALAG